MSDNEITDPRVHSNSSLKSFRRCPLQWRFKYVEGLKAKERGLPLKRGSWMHELLEVHYQGGDWRERQALLTGQFMELFEEEREQYGDLPAETERMMTSYLMRWAKHDAGLEIVDVEIDEQVKLPNGDSFRFIIDLLVKEEDGGLWIWDHKTSGEFLPEGFMLIDAQLSRYFWAARKIGIDVRGILFNEVITRAPTLPKVLQSGRLEQRANIRCDVYTYYREIKRLGQDPKDYASFLKKLLANQDQWFRRTRLPKDKPLVRQTVKELMMTVEDIHSALERDAFPRTPDKSCQWSCDYRDPCAILLQGGSIDQVIKHKFTTREQREKEERRGTR